MSGDKLLKLALIYGEKNFDPINVSPLLVDKRKKALTNVSDRDFSNTILEETLKHKFHPKQVVFCNDFKVHFCEIEYSYTTNRNNDRFGNKVFVFNECNLSSIDLQKDLLDKWVKLFNNKNPHRQLSNVKLISNRYFSIEDFFKLNLNRRQVVFCNEISWGCDLTLNFSKIDYKYSTPNNNPKESSKILIYVGGINPQRDMEPELMNWINKFNKENPKKALLNVKILKSEDLGYITL